MGSVIQGKNRSVYVLAAIQAAALAGVSGCNSETLMPLQQFVTQAPVNNGVTVNFCTDPATPVQSSLKYLVILDHSGSNALNYQMDANGDGAPAIPLNISTSFATDPLGASRYGSPTAKGTLLNFLQSAPANDPTRGYALIDFNGQQTTFPTNESFTSDINTGDGGDFYQYVLQDAGQNGGGGGTPTDGGCDGLSGLAPGGLPDHRQRYPGRAGLRRRSADRGAERRVSEAGHSHELELHHRLHERRRADHESQYLRAFTRRVHGQRPHA